MKHFLPIILLWLLPLTGYSQATAYPVNDILQCDSTTFNLTATTAAALGSQTANNYSVAYFTSELDAQENNNVILTPNTYTVSDTGGLVYIRVTNIENGDYDVTSFTISVLTYPVLPPFSDVTACGGYILPSSLSFNYYRGPGGTGGIIPSGTVITTSQTIYVHASNAGICTSDDSFNITITSNSNTAPLPFTQAACDDDGDGIAVFNLDTIARQIAIANPGAAEIKFYLTQANTLNTGLAITTTTYAGFTSQQILYAGMLINGCYATLPVYLNIAPCSGSSTLTGTIRYAYSGGSCNSNGIPVNDVLVTCSQGTNSYHTYTNAGGNYAFYNIPDGQSVITAHPVDRIDMFLEDPSVTVNMPGGSTTNNLCLTVYEPFHDFRIMLVPVSQAVPGLTAAYAVVVKNMGTDVLGESQLENVYNANKLLDPVIDFSPISTNPGNYLSEYGYAVQPSQTQINNIYYSVAAPSVANIGDVLNFRTSLVLNSASFPIPEAHVLNQEIVDAFSENIISTDAGEFITEEDADDYIQYTILFRNNVTPNANTMRVHTELDNNLDWDTFIPVASSRNYRVNRHEGEVDFIFNNINLPNQNGNQTTNQGFLTYKVKPTNTIAPADVITATASIYFDLHDPVITNTVSTTLQGTAGTDKITTHGLKLYPNPATDKVTIGLPESFATDNFTVVVIDVLGKQVLTATLKATQPLLDISKLNTGVYIIKTLLGDRQFTEKIIVK